MYTRMETHSRTQSAVRISAIPTGSKMVVGAKQLRKALQNGRASQVFLAKNADPALTEPLAALSKEYDIPVAWVSSMQDLGKHCGIEVGAAAAAALK